MTLQNCEEKNKEKKAGMFESCSLPMPNKKSENTNRFKFIEFIYKSEVIFSVGTIPRQNIQIQTIEQNG
jgi:hypothetical protein